MGERPGATKRANRNARMSIIKASPGTVTLYYRLYVQIDAIGTPSYLPTLPASEPAWRCLMWISFFGVTIAAAIALSVAAIMLQEVKGRESLR